MNSTFILYFFALPSANLGYIWIWLQLRNHWHCITNFQRFVILQNKKKKQYVISIIKLQEYSINLKIRMKLFLFWLSGTFFPALFMLFIEWRPATKNYNFFCSVVFCLIITIVFRSQYICSYNSSTCFCCCLYK